MKENHKPAYVHCQSNHPPGIIKNIPHSVNRRLNTILANEDVFRAAIQPYQDALDDSGYKFKLNFDPQAQNKNHSKKTRKRKITYFNPPFSQNVQTNIGELFLKALIRCFPKKHPLAKILNRNTVKLSYRCMPNIQKHISSHNCKVQKDGKNQEVEIPLCNCRNPPCPLDGKCKSTRCIVYKATVVEENGNTETYTGVTKNSFKQRFYGHASSFKNR